MIDAGVIDQETTAQLREDILRLQASLDAVIGGRLELQVARLVVTDHGAGLPVPMKTLSAARRALGLPTATPKDDEDDS